MDNKNKMDKNKLLAGAGIALVTGALGLGLGATLFPVDKEVPVLNQTAIDKAVEVALSEVEPEIKIEFQDVLVEVPVVEYVNVTQEVLVDNENLADVLEHIYDNDGKVNYLIDDLDDDELDKIVDRVVFINEIKKLAVDAVEAELFDELDGEVVSGEELDDHDMERLKVDDDEDEILVDEVDFDDKDAEVIVTGTFEQDDIKYDYEATVEFKDGEFDELSDIKVNLN